MTQREKLSKLLHDGMVKASNTPGNVSFYLADFLLNNGVVVDGSPCDLCDFNPPSSFDGKPCTICPAQRTRGESHG